eukprot:TRINITY_DN68005_c0_g4_i1.p1 TRINITY_DN68005_c0_g4~~TRINITY_DN68005_c0_g4_i1.p1  ORF type:complete len:525 (+),score=46.93 TRINITY_DN68005_c0_g4_i1:23-1597(+)
MPGEALAEVLSKMTTMEATLMEAMKNRMETMEARLTNNMEATLMEAMKNRMETMEARLTNNMGQIHTRIDELEEQVKKAPQLVLDRIRDEEEAACKKYASQLYDRLVNYSLCDAIDECFIEGRPFESVDWRENNGYGPGKITVHNKHSHHAIVWYTTCNSSMAREAMFRALRDRHSNKMPLLRIMMQGLSECPKVYNRVVFRGVDVFDTAAFGRRYSQDRVVVEVLPQSTSASLKKALKFAHGPDSAIFIMLVEWAYNLQLWSVLPDEEIMLPPGTHWTVVAELQKWGRQVVVLQQVDGDANDWSRLWDDTGADPCCCEQTESEEEEETEEEETEEEETEKGDETQEEEKEKQKGESEPPEEPRGTWVTPKCVVGRLPEDPEEMPILRWSTPLLMEKQEGQQRAMVEQDEETSWIVMSTILFLEEEQRAMVAQDEETSWTSLRQQLAAWQSAILLLEDERRAMVAQDQENQNKLAACNPTNEVKTPAIYKSSLPMDPSWCDKLVGPLSRRIPSPLPANKGKHWH